MGSAAPHSRERTGKLCESFFHRLLHVPHMWNGHREETNQFYIMNSWPHQNFFFLIHINVGSHFYPNAPHKKSVNCTARSLGMFRCHKRAFEAYKPGKGLSWTLAIWHHLNASLARNSLLNRQASLRLMVKRVSAAAGRVLFAPTHFSLSSVTFKVNPRPPDPFLFLARFTLLACSEFGAKSFAFEFLAFYFFECWFLEFFFCLIFL